MDTYRGSRVYLDLPSTGCASGTISGTSEGPTCVSCIRGGAGGGVPTKTRRVVGAVDKLRTEFIASMQQQPAVSSQQDTVLIMGVICDLRYYS
jgi:hypothetical protein